MSAAAQGCSVLELGTINFARALRGDPPVVLCPRCELVDLGDAAGTTGWTVDDAPCLACGGEGYVEVEHARDLEGAS